LSKLRGQHSETRVDTPQNRKIFWVNTPKKPGKKTHPKFNLVSFLVLLMTKDFIMFKAFSSTSTEFAK